MVWVDSKSAAVRRRFVMWTGIVAGVVSAIGIGTFVIAQWAKVEYGYRILLAPSMRFGGTRRWADTPTTEAQKRLMAMYFDNQL